MSGLLMRCHVWATMSAMVGPVESWAVEHVTDGAMESPVIQLSFLYCQHQLTIIISAAHTHTHLGSLSCDYYCFGVRMTLIYSADEIKNNSFAGNSDRIQLRAVGRFVLD